MNGNMTSKLPPTFLLLLCGLQQLFLQLVPALFVDKKLRSHNETKLAIIHTCKNITIYVAIYVKQKHLGCKKGQGQEEPATKSFDIN